MTGAFVNGPRMEKKQVEHYFKNQLLNVFLGLCTPKVKTGLPCLTPDSTVVFLRLNRIGDALISTPLIRFVKERFGCQTVVVADRCNHFIFQHNPCVDHVIVYHKGPLGLPDAVRRAQAYHPTVVIDLHEQLSTTVSLLVGLLRAPYKLAIRKKNAALFTHTVADLDPARHHVLERLHHIGSVFGPAEEQALEVDYRVSAAAAQKARAFLQATFPAGGELVGVNTSAGEARFWGVENYQRLVANLRARGLTPVVLTAPEDRPRLVQGFDPAQVFCSPSFEEFAAVISQMTVLFSPDTAAVHVAAAYHIPVFGLYVEEAPGHLNWFPYGSRYDWIIRPHTIRDIPFEEVWEQFERFLDKEEVGLHSA